MIDVMIHISICIQLFVWLMVCVGIFAQVELKHTHGIPFDKGIYKWLIPLYWIFSFIKNSPALTLFLIGVIKDVKASKRN